MSTIVTQLKPVGKSEKLMTRRQATMEAVRMRKNGSTCAEIAEHLRSSGFKGRGGKTLSPTAVNFLLIRAGHRVNKRRMSSSVSAAAAKKIPPSVVGRGSKNMTDAVRSILKIKMDADEKLALISLVLDRK